MRESRIEAKLPETVQFSLSTLKLRDKVANLSDCIGLMWWHRYYKLMFVLNFDNCYGALDNLLISLSFVLSLSKSCISTPLPAYTSTNNYHPPLTIAPVIIINIFSLLSTRSIESLRKLEVTLPTHLEPNVRPQL